MLEPSVGMARGLSEDDICMIMSVGEGDFPWSILRQAYLQIIGKLRAAIEEHGALVCSWSA